MKDIAHYLVFVVFVGALFLNNACSDDLSIKNDYGFDVEHLPVPKRLKQGETAEIRFELIRNGDFKQVEYYVRYFQPDGTGDLMLDNRVMTPNDSYLLKKEAFSMYYTSQCEEQQVIDLVFYDSFKNKVELSFTFSNDSK